MKHRLYLLDFDRTLFDTARFQEDVFRILSPKDPDAFAREVPSFTDERTGLYDIYDQAMHVTGLSKSEVKALFDKNIPDTDYCFPDVPPWIDAHAKKGVAMAIITVGGPDYQALKFERAPSLQGVTKHLINDSKSDLLARELDGQVPPYRISYMPGNFDEIWLIDDRLDHLEGLSHLKGVTPVHLKRSGGKYADAWEPIDVTHIINDFGELE
jgi:hypothetical protein